MWNIKTIATAKQAEQRALTVEQEGKANAAKAKWDQEVIKATMVTEAEQKRDVAKLEKEAAEYYKAKLILEGEGEAAKKRLIMTADGALTQKLEAAVKMAGYWATAWQNNGASIVPIISNGGGSSNTNAVQDFANLQNMAIMKQLGLDFTIKK